MKKPSPTDGNRRSSPSDDAGSEGFRLASADRRTILPTAPPRMTPSGPTHDPGGKSRPAWPTDSVVSAVFSECQRYRYQLREIWDPGRPLVLWLLMNPSVACTDYADPTLRKTGRFARAWGYGGQLVGNVHAYRATDKNRLLEVADPVGPDNDRLILEMATQAKTVVLAYGQPPKALRDRGHQLTSLLRHHPHLCHLRLAQDGTPVHPLYLPSHLRPKPHPPGA